MSEAEDREVCQPTVREGPSIAQQLKLLQWAVVFTIVACLTVSACLNTFLYFGNATLGREVAGYERQLGMATDQARLLERVRLDLQELSKTNKNAEAMLRKYWPDAQSQATPMGF